MAAAELTHLSAPCGVPSCTRRAPCWARDVALIALALLVVTALGAGAELLDGGLFRSTAPHPALTPNLGAIAGIFATNLRVLAAPFLLIAFAFATGRHAAQLGDVIVAGILLLNSLHVGLALGRWQGRLVPYLPHLPLEYLAAAVAAGAWVDARRHPDRRLLQALRASAGYAAAAIALLAAAAAVEVLLTPHRP
jgi:hypothetical protein